MLHLLGFVVYLVPLHAENFREHALDQMMPIDDAFGNRASLFGQRDLARRRDSNQRVSLQSADRHGDSGRGNFQPAYQSRRDYGLPFALGLCNCLEVVFLGDRDAHANTNCSMFTL